MITDLIASVLRHWDLEPVLVVERATSGVLNEIYLITTARRQVVLRRHRRRQRELVEFEHAVIAHARAYEIPTPAAIPTPEGEVIVDHDGTFYSLFAFARGRQVLRGELTPAHARSMGTTLARLDLALADFPAPPRPLPDRPSDLGPVVAAVDQLLGCIAQRGKATDQDRWAEELLLSKAKWLESATPPVWQQPPAEVFQLVHGDYQDSNLFFDSDGSVVDVIDWDKAGSSWPPIEFVRALDYALHLDPVLCKAMVDGYRGVRPLSLDDLDRAANDWDYDKVHDHWVLEGIYLRNDDRLRIFVEPGPYVPFSDTWQQLRPLLG